MASRCRGNAAQERRCSPPIRSPHNAVPIPQPNNNRLNGINAGGNGRFLDAGKTGFSTSVCDCCLGIIDFGGEPGTCSGLPQDGQRTKRPASDTSTTMCCPHSWLEQLNLMFPEVGTCNAAEQAGHDKERPAIDSSTEIRCRQSGLEQLNLISISGWWQVLMLSLHRLLGLKQALYWKSSDSQNGQRLKAGNFPVTTKPEPRA